MSTPEQSIYEPLPCPFCDEDERVKVVCGGGVCPHCGEPLGHWYVICDECGASTGMYDTRDEAVYAWNNAHRKVDDHVDD
jgi:hypothetical protein